MVVFIIVETYDIVNNGPFNSSLARGLIFILTLEPQ